MKEVQDKLLFFIGIAIIGLAIFMIIIAGVFAFTPVTVIKPQTQPYKIITPVVKVGEPVIYQVNICKFREAPTTVIRRFVDTDNTSYPLPPEVSNIEKGCVKSNVRVITPVLHSGQWRLILDVSYKVNPLRTESYHLTTESFVIK